jgi:hypothetical protein
VNDPLDRNSRHDGTSVPQQPFAILCRQPAAGGVNVVERRPASSREIAHRRDEAPSSAVAPGEEIRREREVALTSQPVSLYAKIGRHADGIVNDDDARAELTPESLTAGVSDSDLRQTLR